MSPRSTEPPSGTVLSRLSPRPKLIFILLMITGIVLLPREASLWYVVPAAVLLGLWPLSGMPLVYALKRWLIVEFFIMGILLLSWLSPATAPIALSAFIKSNLCFVAMLLLSWTTPFHQIVQELRHWRVPAVMLSTLALMYRYLPVLGEESRRMQRARASRTYSRARRLAWRSLSTIIGQLFVRTVERAERIYLAMCARGWK